MAVSKQDVLTFIAQHSTSERPTVPAKDIVAALGSEAVGVINELKKAGNIVGKRGRTGGLILPSVAPTQEAEVPSEAQDDVASQFAALMEKLESESEASLHAAV